MICQILITLSKGVGRFGFSLERVGCILFLIYHSAFATHAHHHPYTRPNPRLQITNALLIVRSIIIYLHFD